MCADVRTFFWFLPDLEWKLGHPQSTLFILLYQSVRPSASKFFAMRPFVRKVCPPLNYANPIKLLCITCWKMDLQYLVSLENDNLNREKNQNSCDYYLCWLPVHLFALREFALQKYYCSSHQIYPQLKSKHYQRCKIKIAVVMKLI